MCGREGRGGNYRRGREREGVVGGRLDENVQWEKIVLGQVDEAVLSCLER